MTRFPRNLHLPRQNLCLSSEFLQLHTPASCRILQDNHQILCHQFDIFLSCLRVDNRGRIVLIGRVNAERGNVGPTAASRQGNWITKRLCGLLSEIIGQRVIRYHEQRVEWWLTTRIFDLITAGGVDIVASGAGIFAKRAEVSCSGPTVSKDQEKNPRSSRGEDFARFGNRQRRLTE